MISIIVPVYKVEKYIHRCVDSVLNQSYNDFELILIDDGSPDNCPAICDEYAKRDKRIKVIHKENGGLSSARNTGLDISHGDFITFVDSDDFLHKDYLKIMLNYLNLYNADIVSCDFEKGENNNFTTQNHKCKPILFNKVSALENYTYKVIAWAKLYKKKVIGDIRFPVGKINEDDATYYKFVYNADKIVLISDVLYYYFQSPVSITRNNSNFIKEDFIEIYEERINFFKDRQEMELVKLSHIRFCMVLMLFTVDCKLNPDNKNDKNKLYKKFCEEYNIVRKYKTKPLKLSFLFFLFRYFPVFLVYIIMISKNLKK